MQEGGSATVYCSLDCKEAHHGLHIPEEDRENVGIYFPEDVDFEELEPDDFFPGGVYRAKVGHFGILTVSKVWNKAMKLSIGWLRKHGVYFYADDIIIFGRDFIHCLFLLEKTLESLRKDGFIISAKKCKLFKSSMDVLGQTVSQGSVKISEDKV